MKKIYFTTELAPDAEVRLHFYEEPVEDAALERMQKNLLDMALKADQPRRDRATAAQTKARKSEAAMAAAQAIIDDPDNADLPWTDLRDMIHSQTKSSKRFDERCRLYRDARRLKAAPDTALWASKKGNWRRFKDALKSLPKN